MSLIRWQQCNNTVQLRGVLDKNSLNIVWQNREELFNGVEYIDTSSLSRIDSVGLAFLVHCCLVFNTKLTGMSTQLEILVKLYNLEDVINGNGQQ